MAYIIQITGTSGTGKTSLLPILRERIEGQGYIVAAVREPEMLREFVKAYRLRKERDPLVEAAIFSTDRLITYTQKISPRIREPNLVFLSDRGIFDNFIYQGFLGGIDMTLIKRLNSCVPFPDLTICLVVKGIEGNRRAQERFVKTGEVLSPNETPERIDLLSGFYSDLPRHFPGQRIKVIDTTNIGNNRTVLLCLESIMEAIKK